MVFLAMMPCIYKKRMGVLNTPRWLRQPGFGSHSPPEKHHREIGLIGFLSQPKPQFELLGKRKCAKIPHLFVRYARLATTRHTSDLRDALMICSNVLMIGTHRGHSQN